MVDEVGSIECVGNGVEKNYFEIELKQSQDVGDVVAAWGRYLSGGSVGVHVERG